MSELLNISIASKGFGDQQILKDIELSVDEGAFVSILGKSGCGKTTLLRIVVGLDDEYEGKVEFRQADMRTGMVFQEHRLIPWLTAGKNLAFAKNGQKGLYKPEYIRLKLEEVGLGEYLDVWPNELSGGMRQRLALARALAIDPQLLLMDEPFGSLDSFTRMEMQELVYKVAKERNISILMVTHDIEEAIVLSDRIIILGGNPTSMQNSFKISLKDRFNRTSEEFIKTRKKIFESLLQ